LMTERAPGPNPARRAGRALEALCLAGLADGVLVWEYDIAYSCCK
jgi:hypothetical protein